MQLAESRIANSESSKISSHVFAFGIWRFEFRFRGVEILACALTIVLAYLLGSIPTGYLAGRARGIDIRKVGSGNIGATNVFRILGKPAGIVVLAVDALKGVLACKAVPALVGSLMPSAVSSAPFDLRIVAGVAVILGHNYTCWLRFKGGKGIATTAGVLLAWAPFACATVLTIWLVIFLVSKYVSLASISAALALPFAIWFWNGTVTMVAVGAGLGALAIYKHKGNIQRLLNGTENRAGRKKE
jgi:acyl phosphate:glycerol-3-phosphate acyltransferase